MKECSELFDVFCTDPKLRKQYEIDHKLKMKQWEFDFYQDQKGKRTMWAVTQRNRSSLKSDERFKNDLESQEKREKKK